MTQKNCLGPLRTVRNALGVLVTVRSRTLWNAVPKCSPTFYSVLILRTVKQGAGHGYGEKQSRSRWQCLSTFAIVNACHGHGESRCGNVAQSKTLEILYNLCKYILFLYFWIQDDMITTTGYGSSKFDTQIHFLFLN